MMNGVLGADERWTAQEKASDAGRVVRKGSAVLLGLFIFMALTANSFHTEPCT